MDYAGYQQLLLNLLNNSQIDAHYLTINLYLTLLKINDNNYNETIFKKEINMFEDFLRKVNNLKVKIQLKRKDSEIDKLITEITTIYEENNQIIETYNQNKLAIISIIKEKDAKKITNVVDTLTKEKNNRVKNEINK